MTKYGLAIRIQTRTHTADLSPRGHEDDDKGRQNQKNLCRLFFLLFLTTFSTQSFAITSSTYWGSCIGSVGSTYTYPGMVCTVTSQTQHNGCNNGVCMTYCYQQFSCVLDLYQELRDSLMNLRDPTVRGSYLERTSVMLGR